MIDKIKAFRRWLLASLRVGRMKLLFQDITVGTGFFCNKGFFVHRNFKFSAGDNVYLGRYTHIANDVEIGNDVMVASFVAFVGGDHKIDNIGNTPIRSSGRAHSNKTVVKDNVWIGHGCIILAGVTIESGAVVAAGAVVTKDVGADEIVGGSPAKLIRKRLLS